MCADLCVCVVSLYMLNCAGWKLEANECVLRKGLGGGVGNPHAVEGLVKKVAPLLCSDPV